MGGVSNFLQWNPTQSNQETDSGYFADTQRVGGAPNGSPFPSPTANKLFYQLSTGMAALMQMMATKGYNVVDTNLSTLASVLAAIQTTADIRGGSVTIPYSPIIVCDASRYNGFEITLNGNTTIQVTGQVAGQKLSFHFTQDAIGNRVVTWPTTFTGVTQPDPVAHYTSIIEFYIGADLGGIGINGSMGTHGLTGTAVGATNPSTGNFTSLTSTNSTVNGNESVTGNETINGTLRVNSYAVIVGNLNVANVTENSPPAQTDNSNTVITSGWAKTGLVGSGYSTPTDITTAHSGYIQLPSWMGSWLIQFGVVPMPGSGSSDNPTSFNFNKPFPTACWAVIPATFSPSADRITFIKSWTNSGGIMSNNGSAAAAVYIAIGN